MNYEYYLLQGAKILKQWIWSYQVSERILKHQDV